MTTQRKPRVTLTFQMGRRSLRPAHRSSGARLGLVLLSVPAPEEPKNRWLGLSLLGCFTTLSSDLLFISHLRCLARSRSMAMALLPGTPQDDTKSIHRTGIAGALLV